MPPRIEYAKNGDVYLAYQVFGEGPFDLVLVPGFISIGELWWEAPDSAHFLTRLGSFARVIFFDRRNMGSSDRVGRHATLEEQMDDLRAVLDACGSNLTALVGWSEGGPMSILFSATYPERTRALALIGSFPRMLRTDDYPHGYSEATFAKSVDSISANWGRGYLVDLMIPSLRGIEAAYQWFGRFERLAGSPSTIRDLAAMVGEIDLRAVLPSISVPTLVVHRVGDPVVDVEHGRYLAKHIPGARYVELPGSDHPPTIGGGDDILDAVEEFLTGARSSAPADRVLATVLFTDIVDSTKRAAEFGDRRWREMLDVHDGLVRRELERYRGREVKTTGDGFLATFDGPARGIQCALAISRSIHPLGISIRAGLHTGECEVRGEDMGGIAVHIASRVAGLASADEVLVSSTVKDLVAGSSLRFVHRGIHELKGVPDGWRIFAVEG